ncbi:hypothetical protein [Flavobacterium sp. HJJ]|uniref:hypothetical protein n=1 Tax=Flavobacterium sp. HJJ TaxID=2783792 RepID=UPI00188ABFCA|nr:hypothetical protein [Flavobacterium sp. HJJ]MBF4472554.1 hypothetical protein [Flavobacterium sp. HJJ]
MKLVLITAITAFDSEVKAILKKIKVNTFTYKEVKGHKNLTESEEIENNWFAGEAVETDSTLFYAFVPSQQMETVFEEVEKLNSKQDIASKIHIAVLNIEKIN